jgi:hypothetical protein
MEMMKVDGKVMLVNDRTHFCCWWGPRIEQAGDVVARLLQVGMGMAQLPACMNTKGVASSKPACTSG